MFWWIGAVNDERQTAAGQHGALLGPMAGRRRTAGAPANSTRRSNRIGVSLAKGEQLAESDRSVNGDSVGGM